MIGLICGIQKEIIQMNIFTKLRQTHIHTQFRLAEAAVIPSCGKSLGRRPEWQPHPGRDGDSVTFQSYAALPATGTTVLWRH